MKQLTKKSIAWMLALLMIMSAFAGCASNQNVAQDTTAAAVTEAPSDETAAPVVNEGTDITDLPRNETLYLAGMQWGTVVDNNPMSTGSNNALVCSPGECSRTLVYETLYMWNPLDLKMYPLLATGDPVWNDSMTEYTVKINPDAKWSDGTPVTAQDVAYTFECHVKHNTSKSGDINAYLEAVVAQDDSTVIFKAKLDENGQAVNPLNAKVFLTNTYIQSKAYLQKVEARNNNDTDAFRADKMEDLVYSGPYKPYFANDQKVALIRDDNYWGQASSMWGKLPAPKYIAHTIFSDNSAGQIALTKGEVDVAQQFITDVQKLWLEDDLPISTYMDEAPYGLCLCMPTMFFNLEREGLDQLAVRKAISMAIDYDQISASAMSGQSPSFDVVPRSVMNPTDGEQALVDRDALAAYQWKNADIEGANALLDDAGIVDTDGDGIREYNGVNLSFKAECPSGWSDWNASMEIVAAAGKNIGINIETYFPEASVWDNDIRSGNFDISMMSSPGTSPTNPYERCVWFLSSKNNEEEMNYGGNFGHFKDDRADEILAAIPNITDQAELKALYTELSQIMLENVPCVALMYRPQNFHTCNESVWTGYPQADDGSNIPPLDCVDGYGVAALYNLTNVG